MSVYLSQGFILTARVNAQEETIYTTVSTMLWVNNTANPSLIVTTYPHVMCLIPAEMEDNDKHS